MKSFLTTLFFAVAMGLFNGAIASENRQVPYISPSQFQAYSCDELLRETERIHNRVSELTGKTGDAASPQGKWVLGADLSLSWAALFALGGTKEQEAEYAQLKGEYDAIQHWAVMKQCPGVIPPVEKPPEFDPDLVETTKPEAIAGQR